ncbi:hypothetical protein [Actinophytocola sp.]|uniref:hypothetical protein n=1 Tax=Actinophytocola sp. TaxID=1872138 RepID=UPI002ED2827D
MDRLTTGRRHLRAGSVTVTELLRKQPSPARCTDSSAPDRAGDQDTDTDITDTIPVVATATHRRDQTKGAHLAKLATIGVAGVVLCGAVTISSMVADQRRDSAHPLIRPSVQITGGQALLPDKLDQTLPTAPVPKLAPNTPANAPAGAARPETDPATPLAAATPAATDTGGTSASGGAVTTAPASALDLVREFYENLPGSPVTAFSMLSPDLLDTSLPEFMKSWATVTAIDSVDVVERVDGVLATVRMRLDDGGQLRIEQLLTVAESPRRIVGVHLLSAQRN